MNLFTGADVVEFRRRRNMSRKALAEASGLTESKIWRIEAKGWASDEEERALAIVGVIGSSAPTPPAPPAPPPTPTHEPPRTEVVEDVLASAPTITVDWNAALKSAESLFLRYVSNSELQTFKRCRRKWWLSWYRGLVPITEPPVGVRQIGNRLHRALQAHYQPDGGTDMLAALEREIALDRAALGADVSEDVLLQFTKEADLERIMLEGYVQWLAETGADADLEVVSSETYLEREVPGLDGVAAIGKIDTRVRRRTDGARLFIDHKSVANLTQPVMMLPLDEQMKHYHFLEWGQSDQEPTAGALYNMLRRVKRSEKATPPFYSRVEVRHNEYELHTYEERLRGEITDMQSVEKELAAGRDHHFIAYPRPARECVWDCPFFAVCPMFDDGSRAEDMLSNLYTQRNPLEYYMEEIIGETE